MPKMSQEKRKKKAKKYAEWGSKIEEKYYDKLSLAIAKRDKDGFLKTCKEAGVPEDVLAELASDVEYLKSEEGWGGGWGGGWG